LWRDEPNSPSCSYLSTAVRACAFARARLRACACVCANVRVRACMRANVRARAWVQTCVCVRACARACSCACMRIRVCVCACERACVRVRVVLAKRARDDEAAFEDALGQDLRTAKPGLAVTGDTSGCRDAHKHNSTHATARGSALNPTCACACTRLVLLAVEELGMVRLRHLAQHRHERLLQAHLRARTAARDRSHVRARARTRARTSRDLARSRVGSARFGSLSLTRSRTCSDTKFFCTTCAHTARTTARQHA
jgi:hypothetical protein